VSGESADIRIDLADRLAAPGLIEYARTVEDGALADAACAVLVSTGEPRAWAEAAVTSMPEAQLQRICERAGLDRPPSEPHPLAFTDRHGYTHLPLDSVVHLARAFADAEPRTVLDYLDDYEGELRAKGTVLGERWYHEYLRSKGPGHALARRWTGPETESETMRRELDRLRALVSSAAHDLMAAGDERKARRLFRALDGQ
jgi:hypothetical protein